MDYLFFHQKNDVNIRNICIFALGYFLVSFHTGCGPDSLKTTIETSLRGKRHKSCSRHECRECIMEENTTQEVVVEKQKNSMGVAGFVLALLGLIFCWVPVLNWILWALGLIFSIIGVCKKNAKKGLAITGLILSCIGIIVIIILLAAVGGAAAAFM